jgi:succinyl-diaminopimelate desuccinylase
MKMNKALDEKIVSYLAEHRQELIEDIQRLVAIQSVDDSPNAAPGAPFGPGVALALDAALAQCAAEGMTTRNFDGYAGDATWGEGEDAVAVLTHLDTVPLGDGWTRDPLGGQVEGDLIYGRGTNDDKGPGVSALWAVKALMAAGSQPKRPIRLIYGCCEETASLDLEHYLKHAAAPAYAFTPDAEFPVIHAEKSFVACRARYNFAAPTRLRSLKAGTRVNVVPAVAVAALDGQGLDFPEDEHITLSRAGEKTVITAQGKAAHASMPQGGLNAIGLLMSYLARVLPQGDGALLAVSTLAADIGTSYDGAGCHVACADAVSGPLTFNVGLLEGDERYLTLQIDIRHPVTLDEKETARKLGDFFTGHGFSLEKLSTRPGLYYPKDHPLVDTLQGVYNEVTGRRDEPIAIGGGTYAKGMPCPTVAFGPCFPWDSETAHIADEYMSIDSLIKAARIYAHALMLLSEME